MHCPLYQTARKLGLHPYNKNGHSCYASALGAVGGATTGELDDCTRHVNDMYHALRADEAVASNLRYEAEVNAEEAEHQKDQAEETLRRSRIH